MKKIKKNVKNKPTVAKKSTKRVITSLPVPTEKKQKKEKTAQIPSEKRPRKARKTKPKSIMYFTQDTEDAIIKYNNTKDDTIRNNVYNECIKYPFEKLVENIFNTFKFSYFETSPQDVQKETVSHLVSNIQKFESGKGKAFSYFSIIAKHYLIALNNGIYKRRNQHVEIGEEQSDNSIQLQTEDKHHKESEMTQFMSLMISFWEKNVYKIFTKQRDLEIAQAVIELFRSSERIDSFNKKALYLYIREISSCKTQQITKVINKMKQYQIHISQSYINTGFINTESYIKV